MFYLAKLKSMESLVEKVKTLSDNCTDSIESLSNPAVCTVVSAVLSCCLSIVLWDLTRDTLTKGWIICLIWEVYSRIEKKMDKGIKVSDSSWNSKADFVKNIWFLKLFAAGNGFKRNLGPFEQISIKCFYWSKISFYCCRQF